MWHGETLRDRQGDYGYVTLNACPWWLAAVVATLKGEYETIRTEAAVERHLTKLGLATMSREPALKDDIALRKKEVSEAGPSLDALIAFTQRVYQFGHAQSRPKVRRRSCSVYHWVDGIATDCGATLNLPKATVVSLSPIYAVSRSTLWVPTGYRDLALAEVEHFRRWPDEWSASG